MARKKTPNYLRITLQYGILILLVYMLVRPWIDKNYFPDFESYCPFGGMQALGSYFNSNTLTCSMTTVQIALGLALFLGVILFSKLFCSFICPIGTVTEWLGGRARKLKMQITLKGPADRWLRLLKYVLLFITFYFSVTSSELFCRKFDPYFAAFTGFKGDVVLYYAIPAFILTIVGSFFIRQFWCKYLCPLGAITNIAVYALPSAALALLWVILNNVLGLSISWVWLLGAICLAGFLLEATTLRFLIFPPLRIKRVPDICTSCRICDKQCPMALRISDVDKVDHIDCHLCTDCIVKCPEKGALTINKRRMPWLPGVMTVVLIVAALLISARYELPTISESWASREVISEAAVFEMSGLKNIKCFGSSRSFANHMKEVPGVLGVETFVKHHSVKIFYDARITNPEKLKEAIFNPMAEFFAAPANSQPVVHTLTLGIDRCFDPNDQYLLAALMSGEKGVLAMETSFGEPIRATFFYDSLRTSPEKIITRIGTQKFTIGEGEEKQELEADFIPVEKGRVIENLPKVDFLKRFFETTDITFNKFDTYKESELKVLSLDFPAATDPAMQEWIPYLVSHLSNNDGVVRFTTEFTATSPLLKITYVEKMTGPDQILKLMKDPEFLVHYPDKHVEKVKNPFLQSISGSGI